MNEIRLNQLHTSHSFELANEQIVIKGTNLNKKTIPGCPKIALNAFVKSIGSFPPKFRFLRSKIFSSKRSNSVVEFWNLQSSSSMWSCSIVQHSANMIARVRPIKSDQILRLDIANVKSGLRVAIGENFPKRKSEKPRHFHCNKNS